METKCNRLAVVSLLHWQNVIVSITHTSKNPQGNQHRQYTLVKRQITDLVRDGKQIIAGLMVETEPSDAKNLWVKG